MNSFYTPEELTAIGLLSYGENVLISRKASIYDAKNITLGNHVRIDDYCVVSGRITVEDYVHIAPGCILVSGDAGIVICSFSTLSSRCAVYAISDDYSGAFMTNPMLPDAYRNVEKREVVIGRHTIIGTGSTILPGVDIGEGAAVGAMSLVNKPLPPWGIYVGIPCKYIKPRDKHVLELEHNFLKEDTNDEGV